MCQLRAPLRSPHTIKVLGSTERFGLWRSVCRTLVLSLTIAIPTVLSAQDGPAQDPPPPPPAAESPTVAAPATLDAVDLWRLARHKDRDEELSVEPHKPFFVVAP